MPERPPPDECANCGGRIPRRAKACPGCGADERTGWRETNLYDGLELPDEAWEDERPTRKNRPPDRRVNGLAWYWWCAGVALIALLVIGALALV